MLRRIAVSNQSGWVDHFLIDPLVQARHLGSGWQNRLEFEDDHACGRVSFSPAPALTGAAGLVTRPGSRIMVKKTWPRVKHLTGVSAEGD
jgi:hypothetical protein